MSDEGFRLAKLVQEIADRNKAGPVPIITAEDAVTILTALHQEMDDATASRAEFAAADGLHIACEKGCSGCCENTIITTDPEAMVVAAWLQEAAQHEAKSTFKANYRRWRERVGNRLNKLAIYLSVGSMDEYEKLLLELWRERVMCAFNRDGACIIYPVRPNVCRSCHALDTAQHCRGDDPDGGRPTIIEFPALNDFMKRIRPLTHSLHLAVRGDEIGPAPLCATVHRLIGEPRQARSGGKSRSSDKDKVGRNAPCPCGSNKKYKKCCGA